MGKNMAMENIEHKISLIKGNSLKTRSMVKGK
jgi:D-aminopeptidase